MPRFVLLEHIGHPDDPVGRHFDLLLEDGPACRTWRLAEIPVIGGGPVAAGLLPPHRLEWLDRLAGEVSGGRGFACRVAAGTYEPAPEDGDEPEPEGGDEPEPEGGDEPEPEERRVAPVGSAERHRLAGGELRGLLWLERSGDAWTARLL
jgi:hypothetical protein